MKGYLSNKQKEKIKKNQQKVARVEKKTDLYKRLIETIVSISRFMKKHLDHKYSRIC